MTNQTADFSSVARARFEKRSPLQVYLIALGLVTCVWFVSVSVINLLRAYSFWFDELFSVSRAQLPLGDLLPLIAKDVHPPLYQGLLWIWAQIFGSGELAMRGLSFVAVVAGSLAVLRLRENLGLAFVAIFMTLLYSNWLTVFYAEEARSYGLLLGLSLVSLVALIRWNVPLLLGVAALIGLTHFFGTMLGTLLCAAVLLRGAHDKATRGAQIAARLGALIVMTLIALWPAIQMLVGMAGDVSGGNFWIKSGPFQPIAHAVYASFPASEYFGDHIGAALNVSPMIGTGLMALIVITLVIIGAVTVWRSRPVWARAYGYVFAIAVLFTLGIFALNLHTPMSTSRNFITLVPYVCFLLAAPFALAVQSRGSMMRRAAPIGLTCAVVLSILAAQAELAGKTAPLEAWKETARDVTTRAALTPFTGGLFFLSKGAQTDEDQLVKIYGVYLPETMAPRPMQASELIGSLSKTQTPKPAALMFGHTPCETIDQLAAEFTAAGMTFTLTRPQQSVACNGAFFFEAGAE
ncbi:hypothetical protein [Albirhodobacter sp. R86504]|uniref:hypothetical protein n=1 Tax=Albirhodobacter sp. R86504 TaxID=3093848 RepID=UPI00366B3411